MVTIAIGGLQSLIAEGEDSLQTMEVYMSQDSSQNICAIVIV